MADNFLYEKDGAVTTITFNRPERRNCMNQEVMNELEDLLRDVRNDREVRVLIITGTGAAFSAGADMSAVKGISDREERARVFLASNGGGARAVGRAGQGIAEVAAKGGDQNQAFRGWHFHRATLVLDSA